MKTSHEARADLAAIEPKLAAIKQKNITAVGNNDEKQLAKLDAEFARLDRRREALKQYIQDAEQREEQEHRARHVAMVEAAGDHLIAVAGGKVVPAVSELRTAVIGLGVALDNIAKIRDELTVAMNIAVEHARIPQNGQELMLFHDVTLSTLVDPLVRALEDAGLGSRGIDCTGALVLNPTGNVSLDDAAQIVVDRIVLRVADLIQQSRRTRDKAAPQNNNLALTRDPNEKVKE